MVTLQIHKMLFMLCDYGFGVMITSFHILYTKKMRNYRSLMTSNNAHHNGSLKSRERTAAALGESNDVRAIPHLIEMLGDSQDMVRGSAVGALQYVCQRVYTVVFGAIGIKVFDPEHTLCDPDIANLPVPMPMLKHVVINTVTCHRQHIEAFTTYMKHYLDPSYLKHHVVVDIYGNLGKIRLAVLNPLVQCKQVDIAIETILFGALSSNTCHPLTTLKNPDVSELAVPMNRVRHVFIDTETYDFYQVERFLTYAVNYIGQKHLKKHVNVHIYGDPDKLHPNLRNTLTNLCKRVYVHKKQEHHHADLAPSS